MKTVLYIDDCADDLYLFEHASQAAGVSYLLKTAAGSDLGLRYLNGEGQFGDRTANPLPDFILLDIKMPERDGFEVLTWIRAHPKVNDVPVAMYSSSTFDKDVLRGYLGGTTFYIPKPQGIFILTELARALDDCLNSNGKSCDALMRMSIEPAKL